MDLYKIAPGAHYAHGPMWEVDLVLANGVLVVLRYFYLADWTDILLVLRHYYLGSSRTLINFVGIVGQFKFSPEGS